MKDEDEYTTLVLSPLMFSRLEHFVGYSAYMLHDPNAKELMQEIKRQTGQGHEQ